MLTVTAPAKLNLTLEVLGKRPDGFHEIRSVMQTIKLCDSLHFQLSRNVAIESDSPEWVAEESLVSRVVNLLQRVTGCAKGAKIEVSKRIPLVSGLGGDSSCAVATLLGINELWELGLSRKRLLELAVQLGSDIAFFLYGGTALAEGRGEMITPLLSLKHRWVVLAMPPVPRIPGKTKQLYNSLNASHYTDGQITQRLVEAITRGEFTPALLFNTFENVVFTRSSKVRVTRDHIVKIGADNLHLAGSGPTLFSLVDDKARADELCELLKRQGLEIFLAETSEGIEMTDTV